MHNSDIQVDKSVCYSRKPQSKNKNMKTKKKEDKVNK